MRRFVIATCLLAIPAIAVVAQSKPPRPPKRAQPGKRSTDMFYADAFKDGLVGKRPTNLGQPAPPAISLGINPATSAPSAGSAAANNGPRWSAIISAATIEDTVKGLKREVDKNVSSLSDFKGKGHKLARRDYTLLATLFAIAAEFDGDVRWKKEAAAARDAFARSANNFKVATDQAFNEAKARKQELSDLVGGSSPFSGKEAEPKTQWSHVAARTPLMQFLETAWEPRLKPAVSDKAQFTANSETILRDAELFVAIGEVLAKDGMADADSAEYQEFCQKLKTGATEIIDAVKQKNFDQASKAGAIISKACAECHENYRS